MIEAFWKRPGGAELLAIAAVLGVSILSAPYTVDDAFIVARYAQNLAAGAGYGMNPHVASDGVTGPLWIVPSLLAVQLGLPPIAASKLVGVAGALLAVLVTLAWARRRARGRAACWASALVLACLPDLGTWAVSGLETGAALCSLTLLASTLLSRTPRGLRAVTATLALAWLRPELAPCVTVLWLAWITRAPRAAAPYAALGMLAGVSVLGFRLMAFDHLWPLTASAKPADLAQGAEYALRGTLLTTSVAGAGLAWLGAVRGRREDRWLLAAVSAHVLAVAIAGGDWMPGARLLVPIAGLYALLVGRGWARLTLRRPAWAGLALTVALTLPVLDLALRVPDLRANAVQRRGPARALAERLKARGGVVGLLDVGYLGYASGLEVIDFGGLTDPQIAFLPGGHIDKRIDERLLRARNPGTLVLHSTAPPVLDSQKRLVAFSGYPVERRVAAMPWVQDAFRVADYVRLNPDYGYIVLVREAPANR